MMASRPRAGRGTAGRDSSKDVDVEADLLARVLEGIKKARDQHDRQRELGMEIMVLEEEMKSEGKCCIVRITSKHLFQALPQTCHTHFAFTYFRHSILMEFTST